jgi:hypothetical protein
MLEYRFLSLIQVWGSRRKKKKKEEKIRELVRKSRVESGKRTTANRHFPMAIVSRHFRSVQIAFLSLGWSLSLLAGGLLAGYDLSLSAKRMQHGCTNRIDSWSLQRNRCLRSITVPPYLCLREGALGPWRAVPFRLSGLIT